MPLTARWGPPIAVAAAAAAFASPAGAAPAVLRLDGIGPLKLGMTRTAAVATGWLANRGRGCPLGATPPVTYRLTGSSAPDGVRGTAEFEGGRLRTLHFTAGVRTRAGVRVGRTTTGDMVARYRRAGFSASARFDTTFQSTFVSVKRRGRQVLEGVGGGRRVTQLGIPGVPVCE